MFEMVKDIILCKVFIVNNNKSTITRVWKTKVNKNQLQIVSLF